MEQLTNLLVEQKQRVKSAIEEEALNHPLVQHPGSQLKHDFQTSRKLRTCGDRICRNFELSIAWLPPFIMFYFGFPLMVNLQGMLTGTADSLGNNHHNFTILLYEFLEFEGLFYYFNMFNFGGWLEALFLVPYVLVFGWNLDLLVMLIELWSGTLVWEE